MKLNDFLNEYGLIPKKDYIRTVAEFKLSEMKKALSGQPSSLEMISSYCSAASDIKHEKKVIVIDAGGTNLRIACVSFSKDGNYKDDAGDNLYIIGTYTVDEDAQTITVNESEYGMVFVYNFTIDGNKLTLQMDGGLPRSFTK